MNYLAGLLVAVSILLSGTQAFAYDTKDGKAVVTFYDDEIKDKLYSAEFGYVNPYDNESNLDDPTVYFRYETGEYIKSVMSDADGAKISTGVGDIKISSIHKLILDNETPNRIEFHGVYNCKSRANKKLLGKSFVSISGHLTIKDKKTNTKLPTNYGSYIPSHELLFIVFGTNTIDYCGKSYNRKDIVISTMNGVIISVENDAIFLQKGKYKFKFYLNPVYCYSGTVNTKYLFD